MMEIEFDKMHGLGNDYVYLTYPHDLPDIDFSELAREISDRHFGVGGDGLVVITRSECADFRMIMFNNDGSEAQMCGNASRCIGRLMFERGLTDKREFTLETKAGIRSLKLNLEEGRIVSVSVNMGKPYLMEKDIPVAQAPDHAGIAVHEVELAGKKIDIYCVGMGNPHGVIYMEADDEFFMANGPKLETHSIWPEKANIEFVRVCGDNEIEMRVWERGTGETLACGTGACASAVASILTGRTKNDVTVRMKGGSLHISLNENGEVIMTGDASHVARGVYFWDK